MLNKSQWIREVKMIIPDDWMAILTREKPRLTIERLDNILSDLHNRYEPQAGGKWSAAPRWTEIFGWMSCPVNSIRAIVIHKEPISPIQTMYFHSMGHAFGVRRSNPGEDILILPTLWNLFRLLHKAFGKHWDTRTQKEICRKFKNGFDVERLSRNGILFLNLALTKGPYLVDEYYDVDMWSDFILRTVLTRAVHPGSRVPLLQFYNNSTLEFFLQNDSSRQRFNVFRPRFMNVNSGNWRLMDIKGFAGNIGSFDAFQQYIQELQNPLHKSHRNVLREIMEVMTQTNMLIPNAP